MVDSSDTERFLEAKEWLDGFLASQAQNLQGVPVLVIANKQDLPGSLRKMLSFQIQIHYS